MNWNCLSMLINIIEKNCLLLWKMNVAWKSNVSMAFHSYYFSHLFRLFSWIYRIYGKRTTKQLMQFQMTATKTKTEKKNRTLAHKIDKIWCAHGISLNNWIDRKCLMDEKYSRALNLNASPGIIVPQLNRPYLYLFTLFIR